MGARSREVSKIAAKIARAIKQERGEWLEVVSGPIAWLGPDDQPVHCIGSGLFPNMSSDDPTSGRVSLRMWVQREDVAPVLTRPFSQTYDDGTFVELKPGTPIVGGSPWLKDGFWLPVEVPEDMVGERYSPMVSASDVETEHFPLEDVLRVEARLGGQPVQ